MLIYFQIQMATRRSLKSNVLSNNTGANFSDQFLAEGCWPARNTHGLASCEVMAVRVPCCLMCSRNVIDSKYSYLP